jgi:hypothetical protein
MAALFISVLLPIRKPGCRGGGVGADAAAL